MLPEEGHAEALEAVSYMKQGRVVDLSAPLAIEAATTSHELKPPDSMILATARAHEAAL